MQAIKIKLPAGKTAAQYGAAKITADEDNIVTVPAYVARALVEAGARVNGDPVDLSKSTLEMLKAAEPWEYSYLIHAYAQTPGTDPYAPKPEPVTVGDGTESVAEVPAPVLYDAKTHALAAFSAKGEPFVVLL